jgi:hypothetical protein
MRAGKTTKVTVEGLLRSNPSSPENVAPQPSGLSGTGLGTTGRLLLGAGFSDHLQHSFVIRLDLGSEPLGRALTRLARKGSLALKARRERLTRIKKLCQDRGCGFHRILFSRHGLCPHLEMVVSSGLPLYRKRTATMFTCICPYCKQETGVGTAALFDTVFSSRKTCEKCGREFLIVNDLSLRSEDYSG